MMENLLIGICIGTFLTFVVESMLTASYKRILVMKSEDKSAECIDGKFYYIVPEEEFNK